MPSWYKRFALLTPKLLAPASLPFLTPKPPSVGPEQQTVSNQVQPRHVPFSLTRCICTRCCPVTSPATHSLLQSLLFPYAFPRRRFHRHPLGKFDVRFYSPCRFAHLQSLMLFRPPAAIFRSFLRRTNMEFASQVATVFWLRYNSTVSFAFFAY